MYMYMSVLPACIVCACNTCGDPERAPDLLELELQMAVTHHVDVGN